MAHEVKKRCRHSPSCYKFLVASTRKKHYAAAHADEILCSDSGSSDSDDDQISSSPTQSAHGGCPVAASPSHDPNILDDNLDSDGPLDSELDFGETFGEAYTFREDDVDERGALSIDEMIADIEDWQGPTKAKEMHSLRECCFGWGSIIIESCNLGDHMLTDEDRDNIRAFQLKLVGNIPRRIFNHMRRSFRHKMTIDSEWVILHRLAVLSGIKPVNYHCCINSCVAYTDNYSHHLQCPFCHEPRYGVGGRARRNFSYLPIIPRLQTFFQNPDMVEMLAYRKKYIREPGVLRDVFDSQWYQTLCQTKVVVDGVECPHLFFSGKHDLALSLAADGFLLFNRRRGGPSATPLLLMNLNLPPHLRTHLENVICIGVIPGPHQPKDIASFICPLDNELAELADGIKTYDAFDHCDFYLHAYCIFKDGDIVAIEKLMNIKGHNGYSPCRSCEIKGVRMISAGGTNYYTPLTTPHQPRQTRISLDPLCLPLRTHDGFIQVLEDLDSSVTKSRRDFLSKEHGIRGEPSLVRINSLNYANCAPWEWMHLFLENIVPTLVNLWTGRFKGLDEGTEEYELAPHIWEEIGEETAAAVKDIPAAFVRALGNIASERSSFTAEAWGFWFMHLAPILLRNRFPRRKYYTHMCKLVSLMKTSIKLEISMEEIDILEQGFAEWVQEYER